MFVSFVISPIKFGGYVLLITMQTLAVGHKLANNYLNSFCNVCGVFNCNFSNLLPANANCMVSMCCTRLRPLLRHNQRGVYPTNVTSLFMIFQQIVPFINSERGESCLSETSESLFYRYGSYQGSR